MLIKNYVRSVVEVQIPMSGSLIPEASMCLTLALTLSAIWFFSFWLV